VILFRKYVTHLFRRRKLQFPRHRLKKIGLQYCALDLLAATGQFAKI